MTAIFPALAPVDAMRLSRRIFLMTVANGIVAIAVILGMAFWMAGRVNDLAQTAARAQLETALEGEIEKVEISTVDYAFWNHHHDLIVTGDAETLFDDVGSGATNSTTFDFIYLLDGDGTPLFAYETDGRGSDLSVIDDRLRRVLHAAVVKTPLQPDVVQSRFDFAGDQLAAVAATRVRPDDVSGYGLDDLPVIIAGNWLTPARLDGLADNPMLSGLTLHTQAPAPDADRNSLLLKTAAGQPLATFSWSAQRPGDGLLQTVLPVILALSVLTLMMTLLVGRAASTQTSALMTQRQIARTDRLTGLANRAGLEDIMSTPRMVDAIAKGHVAVLNLDLNDFKQINDSEGHDAGDRALQIFASRLRGALRAEDMIVRMGGDEFICILIDASPRAAAKTIAQRILKATAPPVRVGDKAHHLTASIGIAIGAPDLSWADVQKNADRAMYRAKAANTEDAVFYKSHFQTASESEGPALT